MQLITPLPSEVGSLALLPGSFNPPTRAHWALAEAALTHADAVLWVMPQRFPHKQFDGATREQRLDLLRQLTRSEPRFAVGLSEGGLVIDMVREARDLLSPSALYCLCGRDAAERYVSWDYGPEQDFAQMLKEFQLLVAPRGGDYEPPAGLRHAIHPLSVAADYEDVSSTEVRTRLESGEPWQHLVPPVLVESIRRIYS